MRRKKVKIGKIDLDTLACAYILKVNKDDQVEILTSAKASEEDLFSPEVICIEVGGSGRTDLLNFDHHDPDGPTSCAAKQALEFIEASGKVHEINFGFAYNLALYVDFYEKYGFQVFREAFKDLGFKKGCPPYLTDIVAGVCLFYKDDPYEAFFKGLEVLRSIKKRYESGFYKVPMVKIGSRDFPVFGNLDFPEFRKYLHKKMKAKSEIPKALKKAKWTTIRSGLRVAYVRSKIFGVPGALYNQGADVVVVLNPDYSGGRKFTVAGKDVRVNSLLPVLNEIEPGWGGSSTGTIIGSPVGSHLSMRQVIEMVEKL